MFRVWGWGFKRLGFQEFVRSCLEQMISLHGIECRGLDTLPQDPTSKYVLTHSFHDRCDGNGNGVSDSALPVACGKPKPLNPTLP